MIAQSPLFLNIKAMTNQTNFFIDKPHPQNSNVVCIEETSPLRVLCGSCTPREQKMSMKKIGVFKQKRNRKSCLGNPIQKETRSQIRPTCRTKLLSCLRKYFHPSGTYPAYNIKRVKSKSPADLTTNWGPNPQKACSVAKKVTI